MSLLELSNLLITLWGIKISQINGFINQSVLRKWFDYFIFCVHSILNKQEQKQLHIETVFIKTALRGCLKQHICLAAFRPAEFLLMNISKKGLNVRHSMYFLTCCYVIFYSSYCFSLFIWWNKQCNTLNVQMKFVLCGQVFFQTLIDKIVYPWLTHWHVGSQ